MIGRLRGILAYKSPPWLVIDVGGVGYELEAPMSTHYDLPDVGREVLLFTHYAQKEDSVALYGFLREGERRLFRDVQKVSGVGAKIALAVLSGASVDEFARMVQAGDIAALLDPATFDADKLIAAVDTSTLDDATKTTLKTAIEGARNNPGAVQAVIDQVKAAMGM